jgi:hypothetical protein
VFVPIILEHYHFLGTANRWRSPRMGCATGMIFLHKNIWSKKIKNFVDREKIWG